MKDFARQFIVPLAAKFGWKQICEVGARDGATTERLLALPGVNVTVIDPCLDLDLQRKFAPDQRVIVRRSNSLDALPLLTSEYDCILIDGDHNWYTVYNELKTISERRLLRRGGMIFLHDVEWPYSRRDMYYQPDTIPPEYRHAFAQKGIVPGQIELSESSDFNAALCNALTEGGMRNGVLTAIEDFFREHRGEYHFFRIREQYGLGVLRYRTHDVGDLWFWAFALKTLAFNGAKRTFNAHFPSAYALAKVVLKRGR
jgi:hypothetical protein